MFNHLAVEVAVSAVREVPKAFEELVPASELIDRTLAIAIDLHHPGYDCFHLALAEQRSAALFTADDRLIRRCADSRFAKLLRSL
jgi:predicted nucleic acid-binding protein